MESRQFRRYVVTPGAVTPGVATPGAVMTDAKINNFKTLLKIAAQTFESAVKQK